MNFQIEALPEDTLQSLFGLGGQDLAARNAALVRVETAHSLPCRISLEDAEPGEEVMLAPYTHQHAASPYHASGPIFVRRGIAQARPQPGEIPNQFRPRLLSVRGYDSMDHIVDCDVCEGSRLESMIAKLFAMSKIAYLHIHFARYGCFGAKVLRTG